MKRYRSSVLSNLVGQNLALGVCTDDDGDLVMGVTLLDKNQEIIGHVHCTRSECEELYRGVGEIMMHIMATRVDGSAIGSC